MLSLLALVAALVGTGFGTVAPSDVSGGGPVGFAPVVYDVSGGGPVGLR